MQTKPEKILIVGPCWVGDIIMAQVLFKILRQQNPHVLIDVLTPCWAESLLSRMPEVSHAIELPFGHGELKLKKRYLFGKSLREKNYQHAFVLTTSFKSALIPFFAKIPVRTGFVGECRYGLLNDFRRHFKKYSLRIDQYIALAGLHYHHEKCFTNVNYLKEPESMVLNPDPTAHYFSYALPNLTITEKSLREALQKYALSKDNKKILALCPSSAAACTKRWPVEYFGEVADQLLDLGWQIWLFGSSQDQELARLIQTQTSSRCVDLIGRTTLVEAVDLLSCVDVVIANDSGLTHVAAALDKPIVAIYGPTSPYHSPPLTKNAKILYNEHIACRPCRVRQQCFYAHQCMRTISPEVVVEAILASSLVTHVTQA
jgi:heptosyltransferase-2